MDKYKFFLYDISKFTGYRKIVEKSNLKSFELIKLDGYELIYSRPQSLHFKIEKQLFRRLKLLNISNDIKYGSISHKILQLIEKSEEKDKITYPDSYNYSYYTDRSSYYDETCKDDAKESLKYQSNKYNQKLKQYENKSRIRK